MLSALQKNHLGLIHFTMIFRDDCSALWYFNFFHHISHALGTTSYLVRGECQRAPSRTNRFAEEGQNAPIRGALHNVADRSAD